MHLSLYPTHSTSTNIETLALHHGRRLRFLSSFTLSEQFHAHSKGSRLQFRAAVYSGCCRLCQSLSLLPELPLFFGVMELCPCHQHRYTTLRHRPPQALLAAQKHLLHAPSPEEHGWRVIDHLSGRPLKVCLLLHLQRIFVTAVYRLCSGTQLALDHPAEVLCNGRHDLIEASAHKCCTVTIGATLTTCQARRQQLLGIFSCRAHVLTLVQWTDAQDKQQPQH